MSVDTTASIRLQDGRTLAYAEYGDRSGTPVVFFHGSPGSRLGGRLLDHMGKALGAWILAPDRPGQGRSSIRPVFTIPGWVDDLVEFSEELGIDRFGVVGFSGGGPYVAACAHQIPDQLLGAAMVSAIAPPEASIQDMHPSNRLKTWILRTAPQVVETPLRLSARIAERDSQWFASVMAADSSEADRAALSRAEVAEVVRDEFVEAVRPGIDGIARETMLYERPWGFDLEGIDYPIRVYQGGRDLNVPPDMGRYLANRLPAAHLVYYPEEGHLSTLVNHTEEIVSSSVG